MIFKKSTGKLVFGSLFAKQNDACEEVSQVNSLNSNSKIFNEEVKEYCNQKVQAMNNESEDSANLEKICDEWKVNSIIAKCNRHMNCDESRPFSIDSDQVPIGVYQSREHSNDKTSEHASQETSLSEIIEQLREMVIPKWISYLNSKTKAKENSAKLVARNDTIWKKLIRDVREFYRIFHKGLSICENHNSTLVSGESNYNCVQLTLRKVGVELSIDDASDAKLYEFLHQTHKRTLERLFCDQDYTKSPFAVLDGYNERKLGRFMKHPSASKMFLFVFSNFLEDYIVTISKNYRARVTKLLCCVLKCYKKMKKPEDIHRIEHWTR